jgi:dolichol-phosphate mannosyltransferase
MSRLLIFIPSYNCAPQIKPLLEEGAVSAFRLADEVLMLDNRSQDGTSASAEEVKNRLGISHLKIAKNETNVGLGGSHKIAFRYAETHGFDLLVVLHGDNQASPRDVERLVRESGSHPELDAILGDRFSVPSGLQGYSWHRTWGNIGLNFIFSLLLGKRIRDLGSGLNLFKVGSLMRLPFESYSNGCDFHTEMLLDIIGGGWKIKYQPILWRESDQKSNINPFAYGLKILKTLLHWRIKKAGLFRSRPLPSES